MIEVLALNWRYDLQPGDEREIEHIIAASGFFNAEEIGIAVELALDRIQKGKKSDYHFLVALQHGKWVGYTCYGSIDGTDRRYDLYWIAVAPDMQRMGAGRLLLAETERIIRQNGGKKVYIETAGRAQYEPTREFYSKGGYQLAACLKDFYADGDDKLVYEKSLT